MQKTTKTCLVKFTLSKDMGRICPFTISCLQDDEEIINELSYRV